jgi:hypothetical protein
VKTSTGRIRGMNRAGAPAGFRSYWNGNLMKLTEVCVVLITSHMLASGHPPRTQFLD